MEKIATVMPNHLSIERFRRSVNRKMWVVIGFFGLITFASLSFSGIALVRPPPVIVFDSKGQPIIFEDTVTPRLKLEQVRVEWFAKHFLEQWLLVDSATVKENFTNALNLMSPTLRGLTAKDIKELERRKEYASFNTDSFFKSFETRIAAFDPNDPHAVIRMVAWGRICFTPRFGNSGQEKHKWFLAELTLERVPVARNTIHGLLVSAVHTSLFENEEALSIYSTRLKQKRGS